MSTSRAAASRLESLRALARAAGADAVFLAHPPTVRWACDFSGSNALLVVTPEAAHLVTDGRYRDQAAAEVQAAEVHVAPGLLARFAASQEWLAPGARVVFEADHVTVAQRDQWAEAWPDVRFEPIGDGLAEAVAVKDAAGVDAMRRAQARTVAVFEAVVRTLRPGITERDVAAELTYAHLRAGASAMSFEPIVAAGARGALPHARPSDAPLYAGDLVVIDVGGVFDGVCSDFTRTVALGDPGDEARADHAAVAQAHDAGVAALRAGVSGAAVDRAARDVLAASGRDAFFTHSLGHGVGMEVHEWPRVSQQAAHRVPAGATVTIEPGVYRPGRWGIRTESLVAVTAQGAEILAPYPTDLLVL